METEIHLTANEAAFVDGFIEAFYWADTGEEDQPDSEAQLDGEALRRIQIECLAFIVRYDAWLDSEKVTASYNQAGADFYFTRQGHGVGFWSRPEYYGAYADYLTAAAESFGNLDLYQGDNGLIYC